MIFVNNGDTVLEYHHGSDVRDNMDVAYGNDKSLISKLSMT